MELFNKCCVALGLLFLTADSCSGDLFNLVKHIDNVRDRIFGNGYPWDDEPNNSLNDDYDDNGHRWDEGPRFNQNDDDRGRAGNDDNVEEDDFCVGENQKQPSPPTSLSDRRALAFLMDRPTEPLFVPKGRKGEVIFETPRDTWQKQPSPPTSLSDRRDLAFFMDRPTEPLFVPKGRKGEVIFETPRDTWQKQPSPPTSLSDRRALAFLMDRPTEPLFVPKRRKRQVIFETPRDTWQQQPSLPTSLSDRRALAFLMDRPTEPLFVPKGRKGEVIFETPRDTWPEAFQNMDSDDLSNRAGSSSSVSAITVKDMKLPDLNLSKGLSRDEMFNTFIPYHRKMAAELINLFVGMPTYEDFANAAALTRDVVNSGMWTFAMQVALTNRNDTQDIDVPALTAIMPQKFIDGAVFSQARQQVSLLRESERTPIEIPRDYTASDLDLEHRLAYFREDMGINLHHWTWHLVYPFAGTPEIVNKDRRGELFYYQHQQIIARYNAERLSNKLLRVEPFNNFNEPIKEGYFPKLDTLVASRNWPSRQPNSKLQDVKRVAERLVFDIHQLEIWRDRILQAIHEGRALRSNYSYVNLVNTQGIDVLGDIMESSARNVNPNLYGDLHNLGHVAFAIVHDPDQRYLEAFGVIGDLATSMRDPIFYRWHKYVDEIFQQHKATLQPYTEQELGFSGINVTSVEVRTQGYPTNELHTFWQQSDVDLSRGLDISPQGTVYARLNHIQHAPFTYRIQVQNSGEQRRGTVRIFLAPKFDERGLPMIFSEQRLLFIEMDKFTVTLRSGSNTIERRSTQSSITIPYERTFRPLDQVQVTPTDQEYNYCGCGWPQHMLIPKGSPEGFPVEVFVMVSNYEDDRVDQPPPTGCKSGVSYCGLRNRKYPDRRPMGFPFDRNNRPGVETVQQYLGLNPNMFLADVKIIYEDNIKIRVTRNGTQITPNNTTSLRP